jgi:putative peptide zinc metalloprotease protein
LMNARGIDPALLARSQVAEREYQSTIAEYQALFDQKKRLAVTAPIAGRVVDVTDDIEPGLWLPAKSRLLSIVDSTQTVAEAYIDESDLERIAPGDSATFHAEADDRISITLKIVEIARASTRAFREPYLASVHGGPIAARADKNNDYIPDRTIYRVTLAPTQGELPPRQILLGTVTMQGTAISMAARAWRALLAVGIREAGA